MYVCVCMHMPTTRNPQTTSWCAPFLHSWCWECSHRSSRGHLEAVQQSEEKRARARVRAYARESVCGTVGRRAAVEVVGDDVILFIIYVGVIDGICTCVHIRMTCSAHPYICMIYVRVYTFILFMIYVRVYTVCNDVLRTPHLHTYRNGNDTRGNIGIFQKHINT